MQTAIFVYQPASMTISTNESNLQLCGMNNETVSLSPGHNERSVAPGIYKIVSNQDVEFGGDTFAFDTVPTTSKTSVPTVPVKATQALPPISAEAFNAFFAVPDAKVVQNP